jgi:hypothetical protein
MGDAERLDLRTKGRRRGDGDLVPGVRERTGYRNQRVEVAGGRVNCEESPHGLSGH